MELNLTEYILNPEKLNASTLPMLARMVVRYPYFQIVRILYLRNLYQLHDRTFGEELKKAALYVDRRILFFYLEGEKLCSELKRQEEHRRIGAGFSTDEDCERTDVLINTFLSKRPEERVRKPRAADVTTDYIAYMLLNENETEANEKQEALPMAHQELIDDFIGKSGGRFKLPKDSADQEEEIVQTESFVPSGQDQILEDDEFLTETLAKIYIKQGRYAKAIEIIRKLSLKNPKKNRYFADQIRFLEKLIINNKYK